MNRQARSATSVANGPGCVKTLRGTTTSEISGPMVMRRPKKRKNLSSARHYDQIRFRFRTGKTLNRRRPTARPLALTQRAHFQCASLIER